MEFSRGFFALQVELAVYLAAHFGMSLSDALFHYTTFSKIFGDRSDWASFAVGVAGVEDPAEYSYRWYLQHKDPANRPTDSTFHGQPLFGCFYFVIRDTTIIRPHFIKNDPTVYGPLSRERAGIRRDELRRMFTHIGVRHPEATTVLGNSWLYNLAAYRRVFPPDYTTALPQSEAGEFQFLARWGQMFDRHWEVRPRLRTLLFDRLRVLTDLEQLRSCFPYQILQPRCSIDSFFHFYGIR